MAWRTSLYKNISNLQVSYIGFRQFSGQRKRSCVRENEVEVFSERLIIIRGVRGFYPRCLVAVYFNPVSFFPSGIFGVKTIRKAKMDGVVTFLFIKVFCT
jgi:hypothetical protein